MGIAAAITLGITIAGFAGGIIIKVSDLSIKFGKLTQTVEQSMERDREDRDQNNNRFNELYTRTNAHESSIAALTNSVTSLTSTCQRIESKLDRLIEKS